MTRRIDLDESPAIEPGMGAVATTTKERVTVHQLLTLVAFVGVAVVALVFNKDIGFVAITAAVLLAMTSSTQYKGAVNQIA